MNSKLSLIALVGSVAILSGCATAPTDPNTTTNTINAGMGIGKTVFQSAVNQRCHQEMANSSLWKVSKIVFNKSKQERITYSVCGCVSQKAVQDVTIDQLVLAAVDSNAKKTLILSSVSKSLNGCYKQTMKEVKGL